MPSQRARQKAKCVGVTLESRKIALKSEVESETVCVLVTAQYCRERIVIITRHSVVNWQYGGVTAALGATK